MFRCKVRIDYLYNMLRGSWDCKDHTYIEQIQLEKLVNDVMTLPEDLKMKLSLDEDVVSSPKELLSRASADKVAWRNKNLKSGMSKLYSDQREKSYPKLTDFDVSSSHSHMYVEGNSQSAVSIPDQGAASRLLEQISTLNGMMDEFSLRIEELLSKLIVKEFIPVSRTWFCSLKQPMALLQLLIFLLAYPMVPSWPVTCLIPPPRPSWQRILN